MTDLPDVPLRAFTKADPSPDGLFYAQPRFVTHIDDRAIRAVTQIYRDVLPANGRILDLMSSWVSHLPEDVPYAEVVGHGMSEAELSANTRLARHVVQDLNGDATLPFDDASFDAACCCVSVQYLERPVAVLRDLRRVLKPGAPVVITFSDRCFPTKAVLIWQAADIDRVDLVSLYLARAGFAAIAGRHMHVRDRGGDPLWAVTGRAP